MPKYKKLKDEELDYYIELGEATPLAEIKRSCSYIASMALELKQLRAEKKCKCPDTGKPSWVPEGQNYSLSYANPEDIEDLDGF